MPIEPKRIEAAARAIHAGIYPSGFSIDDLIPSHRERFQVIAETVLAAAFPELASDPPTAWVAPFSMAETTTSGLMPIQEAARDAHTKEQT
jgi:hypothetical protein